MDCVRSGSGLELPCEWNSSSKNKSGGWITHTECFYSPADVILISGCTDNLECDNRMYRASVGPVTSSFCRTLTKNKSPSYPAFMTSLQQQIKKLRSDMRPQLSSSQAFDIDENTLFVMDAPGRQNANKKLGPGHEEGLPVPNPRPLPRDPRRDAMLGFTGSLDNLDEEIDLEIVA
jgi:hypothetical protein